MKNLLSLFLAIAIVAIVAPIFLIGGTDPRFGIGVAKADRVFEFETTSTQEAPEPEIISVGGKIAGDPTPEAGEIAIRVPVLMYHHVREMKPSFSSADRVYTVTPKSFAEQMRELVEAGYHAITPDDLSRALQEGQSSLPSKPVLITLDDGFRDQYEHAFPVLKELGLTATFFIVSEAHDLNGNMDEEMIKELDETGMVIGAHTRHHAFLTQISGAERWDEIEGSKKDLETLLGHPVTSFAYPYGSWSPTILNEVAKAGFESGFWVRSGSLHVNSSRYLLRRIRITDKQEILPSLERYSAH
jgi:peptidoglycan/xylan/chitin deacetylase (PgdA/CDA1 family)